MNKKGTGCLTKLVGDDLHIVLSQSEYNQMLKLYIDVDLECSQIDDRSEQIEIPELPVVPAAPAPNIPQCDKDAWKRLMPDEIPDRGPSERPRDGGVSLGSSGIGGLHGRLDIGGIFDR